LYSAKPSVSPVASTTKPILNNNALRGYFVCDKHIGTPNIHRSWTLLGGVEWRAWGGKARFVVHASKSSTQRWFCNDVIRNRIKNLRREQTAKGAKRDKVSVEKLDDRFQHYVLIWYLINNFWAQNIVKLGVEDALDQRRACRHSYPQDGNSRLAMCNKVILKPGFARAGGTLSNGRRTIQFYFPAHRLWRFSAMTRFESTRFIFNKIRSQVSADRYESLPLHNLLCSADCP